MASRILRVCYHYAVYTIGFVVLATAVAVSAVRVAFPDIGIYRREVEAWVSNYMGFPVIIRSLDATWYGWTPHLYLTNIDLLNKAGTAPITHFESAAISIDPLATIYRRRFVPKELTVSGFQVSVARLTNGAIYIRGTDAVTASAPQTGGGELAEWLLLQRTIKMERATVEWSDQMHGQESMTLTGVNLTLRSDGERLQIEGSADLPRAYGQKMDLAFDAIGDILTSEWSGELYVHANDVNPDNWYRNYRPVNVNISGGSADIRAWSTWSQARLTRIDGDLQYRDFAAQIGGATLRVDQLGYRFSGERTDAGGWRLDMHVADLMTEHGVWPEANIRVHAEPLPGGDGQRYSVRFDYLKLNDVAPLIARLDFIPEAARARVTAMMVAGELHDGRMIYDPSGEGTDDIFFDSRFEKLETRFAETLPGLKGASGRLLGTPEQGIARFDGDRLDLRFPAGGAESFSLQNVSGDVHWRRGANAWRVASERLAFRAPDVDAVVSGSVSMASGNESPFVDLQVETGAGNLETIAAGLPQIGRFKLGEWLRRTVAAGTLASANALLRGRLSEFPFDGREGRFQALFNVEEVVFDYSPSWPPVDGLNAQLRLDGRALVADVSGGRIFNAEIVRGTTRIDGVYAAEKLVNVQGTIAGTVEDLRLFIDGSPLRDDAIMAQARDALTAGQMQLELDMAIPVHMPQRAAEVSGTLGLAEARLQAMEGRIILEELTGDIEFTRNSTSGSGIAARWHGKPVEMALAGRKGDENDPPTVILRGTAGPEFIAAQIVETFPQAGAAADALASHLSGAADWVLKVGFLPGTGGRRVDHLIDIESNLRGMDVDLPEPVGKSAAEELPVTIRRVAGAEGTEFQVNYGSIFSSGIMLDAPGEAIERAEIRFGAPGPIAPTVPGLHLSGNIERLDTADWWKFLNADGGDGSDAGTRRPISVDVHIAELRLINRDFADVQLSATRMPDNWEVRTAGPELTGEMILPVDTDRTLPVRLNLEHIHLRRAEEVQHAPRPVDPALLPALDIRARSFEYGEMDLGSITLAATPTSDGINVDRFEISKPDMSIEGSGEWTRRNDVDESRFRIGLRAEKIDSMLQTFGYNVTSIRKGETSLDIDAAWTGAPSEFSLAKLNGSIDMRVRKGQLLDVDPRAGRLFGLLSIQALPRRLMLDFSDLFGKGMAFDAIEGTFQIEDGNAYTNDLFMEGPSASVSVTGRTGLAEQDYDQVVTVMPRVSGTLPVAGAIFGPVGVGVGTVLYLAGKLFDSAHDGIDSLLRFQYTVTGSWDDPVVEKFETAAEAGTSG